ncbi:hypothetical protein [Amycolatopsis alkalitolerans]|nr:hypothetical protein [Amycolatopsis alkalitolerans]
MRFGHSRREAQAVLAARDHPLAGGDLVSDPNAATSELAAWLRGHASG